MSEITRFRGDTIADFFQVTDENGVAKDVTGSSFKMSVSKSLDPTDAPEYTIDGEIVTALTGDIKFTPTSDQTNRVGKHYYDVIIIDGSGGILTLVKDVYMFVQDITKS